MEESRRLLESMEVGEGERIGEGSRVHDIHIYIYIAHTISLSLTHVYAIATLGKILTWDKVSRISIVASLPFIISLLSVTGT